MNQQTMTTVAISNGQLKLVPESIHEPSSAQVLIQVAAIGINRADIMQRQGNYPPPAGASDLPGLEVAGTIVAVGDQVDIFRVGDRVCALLTGGGYAEYCLASAVTCLPIPDKLSFVQAAALPEAVFTVWSNVFDRGRLQVGETLLVHGGSSGIGTTAIQLASLFGAKVIVTAGSARKCQFCQQLGAIAAINYQEQDFVEWIRQLTQNKGVDVILDMVGGDYLPRNIKCLAEEGRLLQIAIQHGYRAEINLLSIMYKRINLTGSTLRDRDDQFKAALAQSIHAKVWPLLETGQFQPIIDSCFALADASKAHQRMESSQHIGKIILTV